MLSFGFDTCIKVNLPFVNCLISDILLDAKPHFNQTPLQFISVLFYHISDKHVTAVLHISCNPQD